VAWLGLIGATLEASFVHSDDGCTIETHCKACLLALGEAVSAKVEAARDAAPRSLPSRGPPLA